MKVNEYIQFKHDYLEFVCGVKYRIDEITEEYYIIRGILIDRERENWDYYVGRIITGYDDYMV